MSGTLVETTMVLVGLVVGGVPLEVYPNRGNGFAASIVGALVALLILIVVMKFISSKPKNRGPRGR